MGKQQIPSSWKKIAKLDPDTAEAAGWYVQSVAAMQDGTHEIHIIAPDGSLGAWGYAPHRPTVAEAIRRAQTELGKRGIK